MRNYLFKDIVLGEEGLLKGPFGSDLKRSLYVSKGSGTYKVYLQENILKERNDVGDHYISKKYYEEKMSRYAVKENDFIVTCDGTLGEIYQLKDLTEEGIISSSLLRITLNPDIVDYDYFYYLFKVLIKKQLITQGNNSVLKHLPGLGVIRKHIISLPDIEDQKKIGTALRYIDNKIKNNTKQIQTLESLAKTIYDYWFVQFDFPNEDGKPYKSSGGKMVWNEELKREIPEGWKYTFIGSITNCYDSKRVPLSSKQRGAKKGEFPYYGATCVMDYVNEFIFDGDYVLMAEDGSIMKVDNTPILQRITGKTWVNNHAHILEPKKGYSCAVLMQLLKDIYVPSLKTGSIQAKITQEKMNSIKIIDIPSDLLYEINKQLLPLDSKVLHLQNEISVLNKLKGFILPLLMNGQVSVNV